MWPRGPRLQTPASAQLQSTTNYWPRRFDSQNLDQTFHVCRVKRRLWAEPADEHPGAARTSRSWNAEMGKSTANKRTFKSLLTQCSWNWIWMKFYCEVSLLLFISSFLLLKLSSQRETAFISCLFFVVLFVLRPTWRRVAQNPNAWSCSENIT